MPEDNEDQLPVEIEAQLELEPKPTLKRGIASLRGVKRSTYMRRSILRMLSMAPEERAPYSPRNGFEELSKAMLDAPRKGKEGAVVVAVFREVKECLGEEWAAAGKRLWSTTPISPRLFLIFRPSNARKSWRISDGSTNPLWADVGRALGRANSWWGLHKTLEKRLISRLFDESETNEP